MKNSIDSIEIIIKQGINEVINAFVYPKESVCLSNGKYYNITKEQINNMLEILTLWDYEYYSNNGLDVEEYKIVVYEDRNKKVYHGRGIYPNTYDSFKRIFGDVVNG